MKKISALLAAVALCLSMASCNISISKKSNDASSDDISSVEPVSSQETTLETFINSESFQSQVETLSSSYEAQGITLKVKADGNSIVYSCQYTTDMDADTIALVKSSLDEALKGEDMTSAFSEVLNSVKSVVPSAESVVVEYLDKDGNVITSYEYK